MTVCAGQTVTGTTVRRRCPSEDTWKKMETLRRGVSDRYNSHVGRTFTGTAVRQRTLEKKWRPYGGVSDRHNGHAGWTVVGTMACHMCPLKDTWKK